MKLTNPTDEELNAAFAEKVAGWKHVHDEDGGGGNFSELVGPNGEEPETIPDFTRSADAVLPWLDEALYWDSEYVEGMHKVFVNEMRRNVVNRADYGHADKSFQRAVVVALLRAHGVEVEFTK